MSPQHHQLVQKEPNLSIRTPGVVAATTPIDGAVDAVTANAPSNVALTLRKYRQQRRARVTPTTTSPTAATQSGSGPA